MRHEAVRITTPSFTISNSPCRIIPMVTVSTTSTAMVKFRIRPSTRNIQHTRRLLHLRTMVTRVPCICPMSLPCLFSTPSQAPESLPYHPSRVRSHHPPTTRGLPPIIERPFTSASCLLGTTAMRTVLNVKTLRTKIQCSLNPSYLPWRDIRMFTISMN